MQSLGITFFGESEFIGPLGLDAHLQNIDFSISPNPASSILKISSEFGESLSHITFKMMDIRGQMHKSFQINNSPRINREINVEDLQVGVYLLSIEHEGRLLTVRKVFIQR